MGTLPIKRTTPVENFTETLRRKKGSAAQGLAETGTWRFASMDQLVKFVLTFVTLISVASIFGIASPVGNATQADYESKTLDQSSLRMNDIYDIFEKWQPITILGKKYLISPTSRSNQEWKDAKKICEKQAGSLPTNVSPEWFEEAGKLKGINFSRSNSYWVGAELNGSYKDNKWKWITGEPLRSSNPNWRKGYPHFAYPGLSAEYCVLIKPYESTFVLENNYCDITHAFVCELY